jgi:hypothetical protein
MSFSNGNIVASGAAMKKLATAITAIALIGTPAFVADTFKAPPRALEPVFSWTGFYVGAELGGEWADTTWTTTSGGQRPPFNTFVLDASSPRKSD